MEQHVRGRRMLLAGFDTAFVTLFAAFFSLALPERAFAYVDPSVITYTIQAVAGVVVALSAVAGVAFRRSRKALMRFLHIDENAGKTVEPSVHRLSADGDVLETASAPHTEPGTPPVATQSNPDASAKRNPTWKKRFARALPSSVFAVFTLFVLAPFELMAASTGSLVFRLADIAAPVACAALAFALLLALALSALRGRPLSIACAIVFAIGLCCWLQAMFLNTGLPTADGNAVVWSDYAGVSVVSTVVWVVVVVGCIAASVLAPRQTWGATTALALALVVVQGVGAASLLAAGQETTGESSYVMTEDGLFTVSPTSNVIVFILDDYDTKFLQEALASQPTLLDEMEGFTWFTNSVGSMIPTRYGLPFLFTAEYPRADEKFSQFLEQRYDRSSYLDDLAASGYSIGIYSDTLGLEYVSDAHAADLVYKKTINFHQFRQPPMDVPGTLRALATCALYRDLPWVLKPFFWFYTDEINMAMIGSDNDLRGASRSAASPDNAARNGEMPYSTNDSRWFRQLRRHGLEFDNRSTEGAFRFIHLLGAHYPYSLDAAGEDVGLDHSNRNDQAQGSMRMVSLYLSMLKDLGVYDNSTVIITADHGDWYITPSALSEPASPIMLVKPVHAPHAALIVSDAPVCAADVLPTVLDAVGVPSEAFGQTLFDLARDSDPLRPRRYLMTTSDGAHDQEIIEYVVSGDALDMASWHLTGNVWAAQE